MYKSHRRSKKKIVLNLKKQLTEAKMNVGIHNLTHNPTQAWTELSKSQRVLKIHARPPKTAVASNKVRIVCMSDTHSLTSHIKFEVPNGDIFIHAGDFTRCGSLEEIVEFNEWLGNLPHKYKIVIAGNHELSLDENFIKTNEKNLPSSTPTLGLSRNAIAEAIRTPNAKQHLTNCIYLQDEEVTIYGIKIYGTPWQPVYCNWAFNLPRGEPCLSKWDLIPEDTDILISHTPPIGHGDLCCTGVRAGCVELLTTVQQRVKPKYHVFGHIHEGYGISSDGKIIYVNASTCDIKYVPSNPPIVFDVSMPAGTSKT